jgi:hypothetical protein
LIHSAYPFVSLDARGLRVELMGDPLFIGATCGTLEFIADTTDLAAHIAPNEDRIGLVGKLMCESLHQQDQRAMPFCGGLAGRLDERVNILLCDDAGRRPSRLVLEMAHSQRFQASFQSTHVYKF